MNKSLAKSSTDEKSITPNRQARRKQKTRASLIKAANEVFSTKGVDSASVTDITEAADVAYGTFYNYFTSVEDIVLASVEQVLHEVNEEIRVLPDGSSEPAIQIISGLRELFRRVVSEPAFNWLRHKPELVAEVIFASVAADAKRDIARGIDSGDFHPPGEVALAQTFCTWGFTGVMRQLSDSPADVEWAADEVSKVLLRVLGVSDSKAQKVVERTRITP